MTVNREVIREVLLAHDAVYGDEYGLCVCGVETVNYGGLIDHVASEIAQALEDA